MHHSFIKTLHCPYCRSNLDLEKRLVTKKKRIIAAILKCDCDCYPILDGVLYLNKNIVKRLALQFLQKEGKNLTSFNNLPFFLLHAPFSSKLPVFFLSFFSRLNPFKFLTFSRFVLLFRLLRVFNRQWSHYLTKRFKEKNFYPAAISLSLLKKNSKLLDAGCGAGHLLYLAKNVVDEENICGVDINLVNIYMAKKYACSHCNYIYLDLNQPLPFKASFFDYIFSNDVFHYLANKKVAADEFTRILNDNGLITLSHLHNAYFADSFADKVHYPETPKGYSSFFSRGKPFLYSEENCYQGILEYIKENETPKQTKKLKTFTLILSKQKSKTELAKDIKVDLDKIITKKGL